MARKKPKQLSIQEQAQAIAKLLFTNGQGKTAFRLILTDEDGDDMGGWAERSVCRLIENFLNHQAPAAPTDGRGGAGSGGMICIQMFL